MQRDNMGTRIIYAVVSANEKFVDSSRGIQTLPLNIDPSTLEFRGDVLFCFDTEDTAKQVAKAAKGDDPGRQTYIVGVEISSETYQSISHTTEYFSRGGGALTGQVGNSQFKYLIICEPSFIKGIGRVRTPTASQSSTKSQNTSSNSGKAQNRPTQAVNPSAAQYKVKVEKEVTRSVLEFYRNVIKQYGYKAVMQNVGMPILLAFALGWILHTLHCNVSTCSTLTIILGIALIGLVICRHNKISSK